MPLKLKKQKANVQNKKKTAPKEPASAGVRKGVASKSVKSKKGAASAKQTAKVGSAASELSVPPLLQLDVAPQLHVVTRQSAEWSGLQSKESALLELIFNDPPTREIVRQHIKAAKEELKSRLEMELPRRIDNAFGMPGHSQPEIKRFGLNLQVKDFDASEKFANSLYDVFNKYRSQISLGSLGKLI